MKKGVIFDLDGTLWDSADKVAKSWSLALAKFGMPPVTTENVKSLMGRTITEIMETFLPGKSETERQAILDECNKYEREILRAEGARIFDGLEDMLKTLSKDYHLYIVSNCQSGYIESFLTYYGFGGYFDDIECWGTAHLQKGENIRVIIERNRIESAVYVGDTLGDCNSAKFAEIPFIHAAYGFGKAPEADAAVADIREIPAAVKKLIG